MLDCIIVGSGLAGISAALTLQANGKTFEIFGSPELSSKIYRAEKIHNYPGLSDVSGRAFCDSLKAQLKSANITVNPKKVGGVYALKDKFAVLTQAGETFESKTVILAVGVETIKPVQGELEFLGRGVSYCATCDGFLYKGKKIAVVCTSKELENEIAHLSGFAEKVYLIPMYKGITFSAPNVEKIMQMPIKIEGEKKVQRLVFAKPLDNGRTDLPVDGVFMLKESVSPAALTAGLEMQNGHIAVDSQMQTNIKGCFAAGDCTGRPYQYAKAVGEGNVAAFSATSFCASEKE